MPVSRRPISFRSRFKVAAWTLFGTLGCLCVSLAYSWLAFRSFGQDVLRRGLISATVVPIMLAGPLFLYLTLKLRELAIVNHQLRELASTDSLTGCLTRRAFTTLVEDYLAGPGRAGGALLVVDADHFKAINDQFGHDSGDEALRLMGEAIRSVLRFDAAVGRLGGEEFAVHLPGVDNPTALAIAERIRISVALARFTVPGGEYRLSVSVGCVVYDKPATFRELFRIADKRLYAAKRQGRDRVELARAPDLAPAPEDMAEID